MKIPFLVLTAQYNSLKTEIDTAIRKVIDDNAFIQGEYTKSFEKKFATFCNAKHAIGVGNGTDALFIALKSLQVGQGDEVIVPANSFIASSESVTMAGAKPVFIDCDPQAYNLDPDILETKISRKTKAIMPVHLYGQPAEMDLICEIARKHSIKIVQDCAQAHGATIAGRSLIDFGDILCFSFYPGKNLGAFGDAGAIVTNSDESADFCRMYANHGRSAKYDHQFEGINSRMDGFQGAILDVKLKHLHDWTRKRQAVAEMYDNLLQDVTEVITPFTREHHNHVYHLYVIRAKDRDGLRQYLLNKGIQAGIHYPIALPNLSAYSYLGYTPKDFPLASQYQNEILSLPIYPELTPEMTTFVTEKIKDYYC